MSPSRSEPCKLIDQSCSAIECVKGLVEPGITNSPNSLDQYFQGGCHSMSQSAFQLLYPRSGLLRAWVPSTYFKTIISPGGTSDPKLTNSPRIHYHCKRRSTYCPALPCCGGTRRLARHVCQLAQPWRRRPSLSFLFSL